MTNFYKKIFLCFLFLVCCGTSFSQVKMISVSGVVKASDDGKPIPSVSIKVIGSTQGTTTDVDGKFKLSVSPTATLRFSFIGFASKDVPVNGKTVLDVMLSPAKNELSGVVVVGYHEVKQKTTTAAIQVITGKDIENLPSPSFDQALQGKVTGVNIQNFSGAPGVSNTFTVRGNTALSTNLSEAGALSTPLFIIDGIPTSLTDQGPFSNTQTDVLAGININDIESIQIAKDAAATAIWGSRGANGVVTIITKKAKKGKPQINLNVYGGESFQPALTQTATGSFERNEKLNFLTQQAGYRTVANLPQMLTDSLNPAFNNATNWQGLLYRKAYLHNVDLSIAGATDALNYRFSLNDYNENGVLYSTGFSRYAFRTNIDYQINKKLSSEVNISVSRMDRQPGLGNDPHNISPISGYNQPSSLYYIDQSDIQRYQGQYSGIRNVDRNDLLTVFLGLHYQILPGLQYKIEGSLSSSSNSNQFSSPSTISAQGIATSSDSSSSFISTNVNNVLSYTKKVGNNNFGALILQNYQRDVVNVKDIYADNIPDDNIKVIQGAPQSSTYVSTDYQASALLSYATQLHYDYKEKYLLDATMRGDASSRFGTNHKWGYFPSVSVGYVISDEEFLKKFDWLSSFKIRASYGVNGDQPSQFYAPYNGYNLTSGYYNGIAMGTPNYNTNNGVTNKNLTWEPTKQLDIGFDAAFLHNRIDVTVDYYNKIKSNEYYTFPLAFYTGYTQQTSNSGLSVGNKGFEFNITTHNLAPGSKFQWTTNFNFSYNQNKILSLPNGNRSIYAYYYDQHTGLNVAYIFEVGKPLYILNEIAYQGVYNNISQIPVNPNTGQLLSYYKGNYPVKPGYPIWVDQNGDYDVWTGEQVGSAQGDLVPSANPNPAITGGFNNNFNYKNFSLSVSTSFTLKRDILNSLQSNLFSNWENNQYVFAGSAVPDLSTIGFWDPAQAASNPNYKAKFPALNPGINYFYQFSPYSTMFNENGAYFKINSISFGYKLPQKYLDAFKITSCRFYATLENVATFQRATVPDAEQVNAFGIYDGATYPIPKKITIGVSVQF